MTDPTTPLTDDDLSAHLDGEADPSVTARLAADPAAQARVAELASAREAVASPVPPLADTDVDALISRALDIDAAPQAPVTAIGPRRRRIPTWAAAAAVVLLVAAGIGLIVSGRGEDATDVATGAANRTADMEKSAGDLAAEGADATTTTTATSPEDGFSADHSPAAAGTQDQTVARSVAGPLVDLGRFEDAAALRSALKTSFPTAPATTRSADLDAAEVADEVLDRCATLISTILSIEEPATHQGVARVGDQAVLVFEFPTVASDDPQATTTIVSAVEPTACQPVVTFER